MTSVSTLARLGLIGTLALLPFGAGAVRAEAPPVLLAQLSDADLTLRINRLEEQNRRLNGRIEELQHQVDQLTDQLKRFQGDIEFRLKDIEGGGRAPAPSRRSETAPPPRTGEATAAAGPAGPGTNSAADTSRTAPGPQPLGTLRGGPADAVTDSDSQPGAPLIIAPEFMRPGAGSAAAPTAPAPSASAGGRGPNVASLTAPPTNAPADQYALASGFLQRRDYELAEVQFRDFLAEHPKDRLVPDALYGLAESFYQRQRYNDAIEPYLRVVTDYASSSRAPEAMLRLGMTLTAIKQKDQACATFAELPKKFPRATSVKAQAEREMQRARC